MAQILTLMSFTVVRDRSAVDAFRGVPNFSATGRSGSVYPPPVSPSFEPPSFADAAARYFLSRERVPGERFRVARRCFIGLSSLLEKNMCPEL
jgi:hypothetical protein